MSANLGLEAPGATPLTQNIILYPYINPVSEFLKGIELPNGTLKVTPISSAADGTQIWKLTHNGVDTHPIHFHLFNVQVINRVTWDNIILPPEPSELGWKDTVRVSPLEDTIVAFRPIVMKLPFGIPDSMRPLNPAMPIGDTSGFNNTDFLGNPLTGTNIITNQLTNFGWEYVWHCHILGHEEMDMMRPIKLNVSRNTPDAPVLSFTRGSVILSWTDGTPINYSIPANWGNPKSEIGYRIERAQVISGVAGPYTQIATVLANTTTYTDVPPDSTITYDYRVTAWNVAGDSASNVLRVPGIVTTTTALASSLNPSEIGQNVTFTATVSPAGATGTVTFSIDGTAGAPVALSAGQASFSTAALSLGSHTIAAAYSGDATHLASTGTLTQTVNKIATSTVLGSSLNPSNAGQSVTFTASVSPAAASGTVTFNIDGLDVASSALVSGVATYTFAFPSAGTHPVIATYNGDVSYLPSTSATITQTVNSNMVASTTVVASSLNPSTSGQSVTFTASVSPAAASGTVTFNIDGIAVGTPQTLVGGQATYSTAALSVGAHLVTAAYSGDTAYLPSTSATLTQTVTAPIPTAPAAPSNLVATAVSTTQINLTLDG